MPRVKVEPSKSVRTRRLPIGARKKVEQEQEMPPEEKESGAKTRRGISHLRSWIIKSAGEPGLLDHCHGLTRYGTNTIPELVIATIRQCRVYVLYEGEDPAAGSLSTSTSLRATPTVISSVASAGAARGRPAGQLPRGRRDRPAVSGPLSTGEGLISDNYFSRPCCLT